MLHIQEHIPLAPKTTMKIGGSARYYAELKTKEDAVKAVRFSEEKKIPLVILGGGSNTIFADTVIEALVVKIVADAISIRGNIVNVQTGAYLANLLTQCAEQNLDLSPLTGIPGTVGGALFGNAGQGFGGIWTGHFVESVEAYVDGAWRTYTKEECCFEYRTSIFKQYTPVTPLLPSPVLFSATLSLPSCPKEEILAEVNHLLVLRAEAQPHRKTAGSVFLSLSKDMPAWKLIEEAGLRGEKIGGVMVSEKHANFFINEKDATFEDVRALVEYIQKRIPRKLSVEMRLIGREGYCVL